MAMADARRPEADDPRLLAHLSKLVKDARFHGETALKQIPFPLIVQALYGKRVLPLPKDPRLLRALRQAAEAATLASQGRGMDKRINEEGNRFEGYVRTALVGAGLDARPCVPSSGYPDLYVPKGDHEHTYIEVKTFAVGSETSSFRSFYMSPPSGTPKVKEDAHHVVMAFAQSRQATLSTVSWKILDLSKLALDIKLEIFSSNKGMYSAGEAIVAQGVGP